MHQLDKIALFQQLEESQNILLAGAGGGFDIFCGIPLYFSLKRLGKNVVLGNYSFTWLSETSAEQVMPFCYKVKATDNDLSGRNYFPEKYLAQWLLFEGETPPVYAFERCGINQLKRVYNFLIKEHSIDTVILIDGGTDSLMFGDEEKLGTPQEDICSMAAVHKTGIKNQYLVNLGSGVDHFHGVSHYRFLENVAELAKDGGYLGLFQLTKEMEEAKRYIDAVDFANKRMPGKESIVSNSIISAVQGFYGNHHKIDRTAESVLWINPLMAIYWSFDLRAVIARNKYYPLVRDTTTMGDLNTVLSQYRRDLKDIRPNKQMPI